MPTEVTVVLALADFQAQGPKGRKQTECPNLRPPRGRTGTTIRLDQPEQHASARRQCQGRGARRDDLLDNDIDDLRAYLPLTLLNVATYHDEKDR